MWGDLDASKAKQILFRRFTLEKESRNYFPIIHNCRFVEISICSNTGVRIREIARRIVFADSRLQMPRIPRRSKGSRRGTSNSQNNGMINFRGRSRWSTIHSSLLLFDRPPSRPSVSLTILANKLLSIATNKDQKLDTGKFTMCTFYRIYNNCVW